MSGLQSPVLVDSLFFVEILGGLGTSALLVGKRSITGAGGLLLQDTKLINKIKLKPINELRIMMIYHLIMGRILPLQVLFDDNLFQRYALLNTKFAHLCRPV